MDNVDCRIPVKLDNSVLGESFVAQIDRMVTSAPVWISTKLLMNADSPRTAGEDSAHIAALAELDTKLPPIIVHRASMRVIDGMHRLRATESRGAAEIQVIFFEGTESEAFAVAVRANVGHGLPLSTSDRRIAAKRLLEMHPNWSDRILAELTGLSYKTIAAIRRTAIVPMPGGDTRIGRDGKARPVSSAAGRLHASRLIAAKPDASLREIAREAGISPATVRDVRSRMDRGEDPVPNRARPVPKSVHLSLERYQMLDETLRALQRDPSLRLTESGRAFLRLLGAQRLDQREWERLYSSVPPHCSELVSRFARELALCWSGLAEALSVPKHKTLGPK
ncbi:ParB N-terminal domain-containing protein [Nocardia sp. NPDC046763]|uniref:ParB N-terminal domain-containing protein n=1 Tax=Nocardia sp. NPDC046763 TaxID=3155256 RepID=UPI0033E9A964